MELRIELPDQDFATGQRYQWDDDAGLTCEVSNGTARVIGNAAGLRTLARHLLVLSLDGVRPGSHLHLDNSNGMEAASAQLVLERRD
jgi:hypothetical protein